MILGRRGFRFAGAVGACWTVFFLNKEYNKMFAEKTKDKKRGVTGEDSC